MQIHNITLVFIQMETVKYNCKIKDFTPIIWSCEFSFVLL